MVTRWRPLVPLLLATVGAFELSVRRTAPPRMMAEPPATFPQRDELGIDGCRSVVVVYREDTANRVRQTLAEFERTAEDYASRGCILVALRATPLAGFEDRFPAFQFKKGLERLTKLRAALGLSDSLEAVQFGPRVYLVDPDGSIRVMSDEIRSSSIWGEVTRALHEVTWTPAELDEQQKEAEEERLTFQEDEARRQSAYKRDADWADKISKDESLQQPTRWWFDGIMDSPGSGYYLTGSEQPLLPASGGNRKDDRASAQIESEAPEWYKEKMRRLDAKAADEDASNMPSSFLELWTNEAEKAKQARLDAAAANKALPKGVTSRPGWTPPEPPAAAQKLPDEMNVVQALERAALLATALSRSGTDPKSGRRLRVLRELEATVAELEGEGYKNEDVLAPLRKQVAAGWATAPPDAVAAARAKDAPPLTPEDMTSMLGDAFKKGVGRIDLDLAKWRFRIKDE